MNLDDLITTLPSLKNIQEITGFLDKKGLDYDTVMMPGSPVQTYAFTGQQEYSVTSLSGSAIMVNARILLRMENGRGPGKLILMTASQKYYEQMQRQLRDKKFAANDKGKPMIFESALFPAVEVALSETRAVQDGSVYVRYSISITYRSAPVPS